MIKMIQEVSQDTEALQRMGHGATQDDNGSVERARQATKKKLSKFASSLNLTGNFKMAN